MVLCQVAASDKFGVTQVILLIVIVCSIAFWDLDDQLLPSQEYKGSQPCHLQNIATYKLHYYTDGKV